MSEIVDCIGWIVRKFFWSLAVFLEFFFKRLLDLLGLIFNIAACCTIVRLPAMLIQFAHMKSWWEWRVVGLLHILIFIMDIPIIIMSLFILCTVVRIYPLFKSIKKKKIFVNFEYGGRGKVAFLPWELRGLIVKNFVIVFVDLFCLFFVFVCLISWRSGRFRRKVNRPDQTGWKKRKIIFIEFFQLFIDIPCFVFFLITFCSWRLPFICMDIKYYIQEKRKWNQVRFVGLLHFGLILLDIPCIAAFLITLFSWRSPVLMYTLSFQSLFERKWHWENHSKIRGVLLRQFLYLFVDVPTLIAAIFVLVTVWRMPTMIRKVKKHLSRDFTHTNLYKREFKIRATCFKQFGMIWVDLFSFVMALIVFCTLWRANPLLKDIKKCYKKYTDSTKASEESNESTESKKDESNAEENEDIKNEIENTSNGDVTEKTRDDANTMETKEVSSPLYAEVVDSSANKMKWSQCMWKIRKKIALHFGMLFFDIPAFPLAILVLLTGLRTSKLISALLGGEFYLLFAISVYMETLKLFRDICFIFLFMVLMALRPIASWVHLLEDEEHREYRLITELLPWIPDICRERVEVYDLMDDELALCIKQRKPTSFVREKLDCILAKHLKRIDKLVRSLNDDEIEGELISHLKMVEFVENKRVGKMLRKHMIEISYIERCDPNLHNENLRKYKDEMRVYNEQVELAYGSLSHYRPDKVPLYATKCGLKLRSRKETRDVLIKCLPRGRFLVTIMTFICTLLMYRAPKMFKRLYKKPYDRFHIVVHTLKEYGKDVLTILQILLVLGFLYRAPIMFADIFDCLIEKRSWKAVREIVKRHPPEMVQDLARIVKVVFSWSTPRFVITMLLFGVLMPAELFLTVVKLGVTGCIAYMLTIILYAIFVAGPFVFVLYGVKRLLEVKLDWVITVVICVFALLLLLQLLLMIVSLVRDEKRKFLLDVRKCDYVRLNWFNIHVVIFEMLEFIQSLALVFKLSVPMYGGTVLKTISAYLLFSFFSYNVVFWITAVVFGIWFFFCGAPHIFEKILDTSDPGAISTRASWRLALSLLANTLFVTILESLSSSLACDYTPCADQNNTYVSMVPLNQSLNNTCVSPFLVEDPSIRCWTGFHSGHAAFALIAIVWYSTTSLLFGTQFGDPDNKNLDIGFSPLYNMVINVFKAGMVVVATVVINNHYAVLGVLLFGYISCLVYTASFRRLHDHNACNLLSILVWRVCTFVSCIITTIGVIIAFVLNIPDSIIPLLIFLIGTFVTFLVSMIAAFKLSETSSVERDRDMFRKQILVLEERLTKDKLMHKGWEKERVTWQRLVRSVREAWKDDRFLTSTSENTVNSLPESNENTSIPLPESTENTSDSIPESSENTSNQYAGSSEVALPPPPLYEPIPTTNNDNETEGMKKDNLSSHPSSTNDDANVLPDDDFTNPTDDAASIPCFSTQFSDDFANRPNNVTSDNQDDIAEEPAPPPFREEDVIFSDSLPPPPNYGSSFLSTDEPTGNEPLCTEYIPDSSLVLQKNGRNLLLILEKHIHYHAYRYSSLSQRNIWIDMVCQGNWTGLLQQLEILNTNLKGDYDRPTAIDVSLGKTVNRPEFVLGEDEMDAVDSPPKYIKKTKEQIKSESDKLRDQILEYFGSDENQGKNYRELLAKVLPTGPVFKNFSQSGTSFYITLRRPCTGVITEYEPPGLKIAIGASVSIPKKLSGVFTPTFVSFYKGEAPAGKKGPVSLTVDTVSFTYKGKELYLIVNGKKVKYDVALSSCKTIEWS